jgi:acetate kinase
MYILLLNAGSSSLKCVLMEAGSRKVIAHHFVDWAGPVTRYKSVCPDGHEHSDEVAWRGAAEGVRRVLHDLTHVEPVALPGHDALAVYTCRARQAIGALAVTMDGVDGVVFAAGVGEHSAEVREAICAGLECLGLELDTAANAACQPDADVARPTSRGRILVITTREDLTMLEEVLQVLG